MKKHCEWFVGCLAAAALILAVLTAPARGSLAVEEAAAVAAAEVVNECEPQAYDESLGKDHPNNQCSKCGGRCVEGNTAKGCKNDGREEYTGKDGKTHYRCVCSC